MSQDRSPIHSELVLELDPDDPPAAPLDLLSTVSSLFLQRRKKLRQLRQDELARRSAQLEAKYAAYRAEKRFQDRQQQEQDAEKERLQNIDLLPPLRIRDTTPSTDEVEVLIDDEISRVEKGFGLKRLQQETEEQYDQRMRLLEQRVWDIQAIEVERKNNSPPQYVEGFPTNLVNVHVHIRPVIPVLQLEMYACFQCKVKGRRCSRNSNESYKCERCSRNGNRCLVKRTEGEDDHVVRSWIFAEGQRCTGLDLAVKRWMGELARKNNVEGIQPLPVWSKKPESDDVVDGDDAPKRWQGFLKESTEKGEK
ncbi:hypothetical protein FGRMN_10630 [Fusarium graminum]|nr:hypothetical protein FGRMN_10630 [Fusarium graminum]